jgi:hypothetical protein
MIRVKGRGAQVILVNRYRISSGAQFVLVRELAQDGSAIGEAYYREDFLEGDEAGELDRAIEAATIVKP